MDGVDVSGLARTPEIDNATVMENDNLSYTFSFIIPALNEEKHIAGTIGSIHGVMRQLSFDYQIVVVDNGSSDKTLEIAKELNARTFIQPKLNISELRNYGAANSFGRILIFLDADVSLTSSWQIHFSQTLERIEAGEKMVTGSHCAPPDSGNLLHAYWFKGLYEDNRNTHIGSAHMIMSRNAFDEIGGFDENYSTGEDYEFCCQAKQKGYRILNNPDLKVIHHDFPSSLPRFIRREAWHGRSDFNNVASWKGSKVALAASIFLVLHMLMFAGFFSESKIAISAAMAIAMLLLFSSLFKFRGQGVKTILVNAGIFYFYYIGRVAALFSGIRNRVM